MLTAKPDAGYGFVSWTDDEMGETVSADNPYIVPEGNTGLTANFILACKITWKDDDGSVIDTVQVAYGEVPKHANPTKEADAQFTYKFAGWSPEIAKVTGDATYTATYAKTPIIQSIAKAKVTLANGPNQTVRLTTCLGGSA